MAPQPSRSAVFARASMSGAFAGRVSAPGAQLYIDNCATCHRTDGHGYGYVFPVPAGNPIVNGDDPPLHH